MDVSAETEAGRRRSDAGAAPKLGRLLQDSSLYLIGNVVIRAVGFLAIPFYSRFLNPAQYGLIELVELSTQTVAIAFGLQAIGAALSRLFHDQKTLDDEQAVVSTSLIATGMLSALVTVVAVAMARPLSMVVFHNDAWVRLLQAAFIAMFFSNMIEVVLVYERIRDNARFFLQYTLITLFATLWLNIVFIGLLGAGVWGFVSSKLVVTTASCVFLGFRMRRDVGWRWRGMFVPELARFGAPLVLSSLSYFVIHFSDRFFLSSSVSLAELGRYALAYKFAILVSALVGDSFGKSWNATLYRYVGQADWRDQFARVGAYFTYILFATGLAIALFSPELLHIMVPPDYFPPPLLLPIIIASYLAREIGDFFRALMLINRRSGLVGKVALGGAVANIGLNVVLIPTYGIYGAAVATFLTWFAYMVVCWIVSNAEHRLPVNVAAYLRIGVLVAAVYALGMLTRTSFLPAQLLLDTLWSVLFCGLALRIFLSSAERWGLLCFAASVLSRLLVREGPLPERGSHGERQVLIVDPTPRHDGDSMPAWKRRFSDDLARSGTTVLVVTDTQAGTRGWGEHAHITVVGAPGNAGAALRRLEQLALPGIRLDWLLRACEASLRQAGPGTVLLTTNASDLGHLAASALKHRLELPWIADFRGQGKPNQTKWFPVASFIGRAVQRMVVENADAIITDRKSASLSLRRRYSERSLPIHVIEREGQRTGAEGVAGQGEGTDLESERLIQVIAALQAAPSKLTPQPEHA